jgi:hypothetical protein
MGGASTESSGVATQVLENSVAPEEPDADGLLISFNSC